MNSLHGQWELKKNAVIVYADAGAKQPAEMLAVQLRSVTGFELPVKQASLGDIERSMPSARNIT